MYLLNTHILYYCLDIIHFLRKRTFFVDFRMRIFICVLRCAVVMMGSSTINVNRRTINCGRVGENKHKVMTRDDTRKKIIVMYWEIK